MTIDFIKCADTRCTNRVVTLGEYCESCKAEGRDKTDDEKIKARLAYLETKPTGRRKRGKK